MSDKTPTTDQSPDLSPMEAAREKFTFVADDLKGRYERATGGLFRGASAARRELRASAEQAHERYDDASDRLRQTYDHAQHRAHEVSDDMNDYVLDHPGRTLLVAAALGFLIGLAFRRRS